MSAILPLLLLAIVVILLIAMTWNRPDPNHLFVVELLIRMQGEEALIPRNAPGQGPDQITPER